MPQQRSTKPTGTATATAAAPARLPEANLISKVLPNGLEIIVLEDHSIPLVTIELAVRNGSYTEPPELNGLSHLYEHMFFKQNRAIANAEDYVRAIGQKGIAYNGTTREEVVDYYFTTTSPNLRTAMQFMKDSVRYPLFDEREFSREKQGDEQSSLLQVPQPQERARKQRDGRGRHDGHDAADPAALLRSKQLSYRSDRGRKSNGSNRDGAGALR
jgi:hypothetical protein